MGSGLRARADPLSLSARRADEEAAMNMKSRIAALKKTFTVLEWLPN